MISVRNTFCMATAVFAVSISLVLAQQGQSGAQIGNTTPSPGSSSTTGSAGRLSSADKRFMMKAAQGGMAEVELGRLAAEHGGSEAVKQFGQRMVDDHSKANDELTQLASQKGVTLPKTLSQKDKTVRDRLGKLSGSAFDQRYMSDMVTDHVQDIADFTREANQGHDSDVKDFASKTLPTLKMHLTMARDVRDGKGMPAEGSGTSTGSGQ